MKACRILFATAVIFVSAFLVSGCDTAFMMGDHVVGISSGKFFYTDGVLETEYGNAPFDKVWAACKKTVIDMKASDIEEEKKISMGTINAVLCDENIRIIAEYVEKNTTSVSVRVGVAGDNMASKLIHENIKKNLVAM
jgi:hypothetical protein